MITWLVLVLVARLLVVPLGLAPQAAPPFDFGRTMRVDYVHTGGPSSGETLALDRVVNDGAWAGSRTQFIDATNLGKYFFEVHDKANGRVIYSRGFASVFGEWETTAEVKTVHRSFHESMRFPWPTRGRSRHAAEAPAGQPLHGDLVHGRGPGLALRQRGRARRARGHGLDRVRERAGE
jgi:hypothetical protein